MASPLHSLQNRSLKRICETNGFTLIELSIVLVIIGLIIGGILTGQALINNAAIRAQLSQYEKYNTAVHTFQGKYGYLPGDIPNPYATQFGFQARGPNPGEGDGNGTIQGYYPVGATVTDGTQMGETALFWQDLSVAGLIDGTFNTSAFTTYGGYNGGVTINGSPSLSLFLPKAKILPDSKYIYIFSNSGTNYYGLASFSGAPASGTTAGMGGWGALNPSFFALTPSQAYAIDMKTDDGLPTSGNVQAFMLYTAGYCWPSNTGAGAGWTTFNYTNGGAISPGPYSCFDNGGVAHTAFHYSIGYNGGGNLTCPLTVRFQ